MSLKLHECLNNRRYFGGAKRYKRQHSYDEQIYSDKHLMALMTLERELPGHSGCINTLDWSLAGDKLLSGSDDTKLNIYHPFENYKLSHSISTGHRANIFTAKFMPQTSDNIILSGAGDSEIRIFDLNDPTSPLDSMYVCHSDQLKKICVFNDNPFEFLTCSQDGTVRHFDRRTPHICSPHNVRSFITAQSKPAKQHPLPKDSANLRDGCPPPIVDYSKYNIELNSMTINNIFPHYFAVAGLKDYIYLHDRRMISSNESLNCVKRFSPTIDGINRPNKHITACKFSNSNSQELIGSWSSDSIYLFNINDSPIDTTALPTLSTTHIPKYHNEPYELDESAQKRLLWMKILDHLRNRQLDHANNATNNLLHYITHYASPSLDTSLGKICCYMMLATIYSYRRIERADWYDNHNADWDNYFFASELDSIEQYLNDAKSVSESMPDTWQKYWALAIGYWVLRGGYESIADMDRKNILDQSFEKLMDAKATYLVSTTTSEDTFTQLDRSYIDMMHLFSEDLKETFAREGYRPVSPSSITPTQNAYQWEKLMYISLFSPDQVREDLGLERPEEPVETSTHSDTSSNSNSTSEEEEEEMTLTRIMSRQIMDVYRRGDESDDSDLDLEELAVFREYTQQNFQTDVDVVGPRAKFEGHCNIETVKDVDFFGANDEYIVSGSDGGYLFIWDKKTSKIVQILQADNEIVNVAKGHPSLPILAVSGIDSTTKIFSPISRPFTTSPISEPKNPTSYSPSSRMYDKEDIVNTNRENNVSVGSDMYLSRSMIAALSRINRLNQLRILNEIEMEDSE